MKIKMIIKKFYNWLNDTLNLANPYLNNYDVISIMSYALSERKIGK